MSTAVGQVLFKATPLILTGLAVALPFRAGLFISAGGTDGSGCHGHGILASICGGDSFRDGCFACAAAGFMMGAIWGGIPGYFKARFGAHEVIRPS